MIVGKEGFDATGPVEQSSAPEKEHFLKVQNDESLSFLTSFLNSGR